MATRSLRRFAAGSLGLLLSGLLNSGVMLPARAYEGRLPVGGRPVKVAAVDFIPAWGDRDGNIRRLVEAAERVAAEGVQYAVFPETAISGYDFADPAQLAPFVDTIPGRATDALLPVLKRTGLIMSVGIAEKDAYTGIFYNTALLLGPDGIIGKYRKNGLNGQDVQLFGPGDTDVGVFDTPIGRIALIICYDDTYWQYDRLAALRGAQIIGWHSVSDRVMPGTPPAAAKANHSTVASVQHMSALNGVWVIGATRSGIERNPINGSQLYYNGGSSIWSPQGRKLVQAPVVPPQVLPPGLNGIFATTIIPAEADAVREQRLAARRPALYNPLLALRRAPVDTTATATPRPVQLAAAQWTGEASRLGSSQPQAKELLVLPELSALPRGLPAAEISRRAERQGGSFEQLLAQRAKAGNGYLVGSYPEREGSRVFHTVALAGPAGTILGRYRATHLSAAERAWASAGDAPTVVSTPLGRIGLATAGDLAVTELTGLYQTLRTDVLAVPSGDPSPLKVEIDRKLYAVSDPPTGRADLHPYLAAKLGQFWLVSGGRRMGDSTAAGIFGPEPVVHTPTLTAAAGADAVRYRTVVPAAGTWINQQQLIDGQRNDLFKPLVLDPGNSCFRSWKVAGHGTVACP
ncbi:carbon-nitrogen hydrolase family protein [Cyanobium sp. Alchichica 3B3-8F6]|uniref:carbon-nitrogen hydrolase family protein n=1 Tax=Cyanobium sp. Alchichica 3B3-8F6 TaxID=2823696 RepID=UPI0020CE4E83|nr:carbon-nitrogen hydrolase family protein [Cyanobium sp. Alchichica 3B3-8F6]MCP9883146.1 carbon-nitrogen hydrolase family protein [Cyanobium sp. Alchichica 3B3-8F6]